MPWNSQENSDAVSLTNGKGDKLNLSENTGFEHAQPESYDHIQLGFNISITMLLRNMRVERY